MKEHTSAKARNRTSQIERLSISLPVDQAAWLRRRADRVPCLTVSAIIRAAVAVAMEQAREPYQRRKLRGAAA